MTKKCTYGTYGYNWDVGITQPTYKVSIEIDKLEKLILDGRCKCCNNQCQCCKEKSPELPTNNTIEEPETTKETSNDTQQKEEPKDNFTDMNKEETCSKSSLTSYFDGKESSDLSNVVSVINKNTNDAIETLREEIKSINIEDKFQNLSDQIKNIGHIHSPLV